ncbi:MAG: hypothetical protein ABIK97_04730 [candidate division WOR-3 bacterium]
MEKPIEGTFNIELDNSYSIFTSKIVTVKVVAVKIIPRYDIQKVQRVKVEEKIVPRIEE